MERTRAIAILSEHMDELRQQFGVRRLSLFGSVARDQADAESDVDVLVDFDQPTGLFGLFRLQDKLTELLGCRIDLGTIDSLKPHVYERVKKDRIDVA